MATRHLHVGLQPDRFDRNLHLNLDGFERYLLATMYGCGKKRASNLRAIVDHHLATVARDLLLLLCGDDLNFFRGESKAFKPIRCRGSNAMAVLSDATGEDQK